MQRLRIRQDMLIGIVLLAITQTALGQSDMHTYSFSWQALAANAGGQNAYSLRRGNDHHEISLYLNEYLLANDQPIFGGIYALRFSLCGQSCFWQVYLHTGGGLSSGGGVIEIGWSTILLWSARIDFTSQFYFTTSRMVTWTYPGWIGLSFPLWF